jgi:hypothetical protein
MKWCLWYHFAVCVSIRQCIPLIFEAYKLPFSLFSPLSFLFPVLSASYQSRLMMSPYCLPVCLFNPNTWSLWHYAVCVFAPTKGCERLVFPGTTCVNIIVPSTQHVYWDETIWNLVFVLEVISAFGTVMHATPCDDNDFRLMCIFAKYY